MNEIQPDPVPLRPREPVRQRPRRSPVPGRIAGLLGAALLIGGSVWLAQRDDRAVTANRDVPGAAAQRAAEPQGALPANQPPGRAETTGAAASSEPERSPAPDAGAPPSNAAPSNVAPR